MNKKLEEMLDWFDEEFVAALCAGCDDVAAECKLRCLTADETAACLAYQAMLGEDRKSLASRETDFAAAMDAAKYRA